MTSTQSGSLVFKNQAGDYFLVPQELVEQGRVPQEHAAEVERLLGEQQDDTQGYIISDTRPVYVQWVTGTVNYVRSIVYPGSPPVFK